MSLILSGTDGLSDVDGTAATPAIRGTDANTGIFFGTDIIGFSEGGVEAARFDSGGNFGLGATPNAWQANNRAIQLLEGYASISSNNSQGCADIGLNCYNTGSAATSGWRYTNSYSASLFQQQAGAFKFLTAASGTAGNAITFTQAMTLDASGNLSIGTTTSSTSNTSGAVIVPGTSTVASITGSNGSGQLLLGNNGNGSNLATNDSCGMIAFKGRFNSTFAGGNDIASIIGTYTGNGTTRSGAIRFLTLNNGTEAEAARIDSSGNLLVGTTSATSSSRFRVKSSDNTDNTYTIYVSNSSDTPLFTVISDGDFNTGTATHSPYNYTTANAANMVVDANGLVKRSTSSLKYKKNIVDATHGLTDVLKLRSVTYEGKAEGDAGKTFGGLIAEEVHDAGLTEFVQYAEDGTPDALAYGNMVSLCVKAIQEQQALITTLTARITALETQNADNPPQGETP